MLQQILLMAPQQGQSPYGSFFLIGAMVLVFYFFMIRPQSKKAKDQRTFMENLQKGDKIVTLAGMHGRITKVNENGTVEVEIDNNVKIVMERSGISLEMTKAINKDTTAPVKK
jgi:preprotein translocase subunit YajC